MPPPATPDEPSDDMLMTAYGRGDVAAFEALYARHQTSLYRFIRRLLGPSMAAQTDEVFQDTWLRVVNSRTRWQPDKVLGASFRTWLFTLANHRVIDIWRRGGREVSFDGDGDAAPWSPDGAESKAWQHWPAVLSNTPSATPHSEDLAFWRRAGERLLLCLDELPLPQRSTFLLHHDDGLPLLDVARALDVGFETAKTRLRYAMSKLRTCMGAYLAPILGPLAEPVRENPR